MTENKRFKFKYINGHYTIFDEEKQEEYDLNGDIDVRLLTAELNELNYSVKRLNKYLMKD